MDIDDASWFVGGWADLDGVHHNTEQGQVDLPSDFADVDYVQIHLEGPGVDTWFTMHGPWEDQDQFLDYLDQFIENDGGS